MGDTGAPTSTERSALLDAPDTSHLAVLDTLLSTHAIHASQPRKSLWLTTHLLALPPLYAYWHITALLPSWRPLPTWSIKRTVGIKLIRYVSRTFFVGNSLPRPDVSQELTKSQLRELERYAARVVWIPPVDLEGVGEPVRGWAEGAGVRPERVRGFWMGENVELPADQEREKGKVMLFLHGGSYIVRPPLLPPQLHLTSKQTGSGHPAQLTSFLPLQSLKHSLTLRAALGIDYRLSATAPNPAVNPFPAALLDALAGFRYLLSLGFAPGQIIIAGDSAGGNLALALVKYLVEVDQLGALLAGLVLLSPWSDMTDSHHSPACSLVRNYRTDYILGLEAGMGTYSVHAFCRHVSPWSAWVSPAAKRPSPAGAASTIGTEGEAAAAAKYPEGTFLHWPRTLLLPGEREMIIDEIRTLRTRMERDGVPLTYREWDGCPHDFLSFWFMEPERTEAVRFVCRWVDEVEELEVPVVPGR
ncbi:alpha/beta-hydrolase [Calocera viscosa TUFC12733]|uniref:Alpha/beta-hydrolase n=1 Tax=Calocera viscosa (strain TUFC12733) TaxID=1330018 RepID=A0A167FP88_CALVF|nr:alpha/beta-hydrolase [Calocera viscosa TUFC12733]